MDNDLIRESFVNELTSEQLQQCVDVYEQMDGIRSTLDVHKALAAFNWGTGDLAWDVVEEILVGWQGGDLPVCGFIRLVSVIKSLFCKPPADEEICPTPDCLPPDLLEGLPADFCSTLCDSDTPPRTPRPDTPCEGELLTCPAQADTSLPWSVPSAVVPRSTMSLGPAPQKYRKKCIDGTSPMAAVRREQRRSAHLNPCAMYRHKGCDLDNDTKLTHIMTGGSRDAGCIARELHEAYVRRSHVGGKCSMLKWPLHASCSKVATYGALRTLTPVRKFVRRDPASKKKHPSSRARRRIATARDYSLCIAKVDSGARKPRKSKRTKSPLTRDERALLEEYWEYLKIYARF